MLAKLFYLSFAALAEICTPTMDSARTYVDLNRIEDHIFETFTDLNTDRCPVAMLGAMTGPEATEITVVPRCDVGYSVIRFVEKKDGNLLTFVLEGNDWKLLTSRF